MTAVFATKATVTDRLGAVEAKVLYVFSKGAAMNKSDRHVKGIGEVSIRVTDLDKMRKFYEEVIGLEVIRQEDEYVFFKVAEGYGGHTQNLALFAATYPVRPSLRNSALKGQHSITLRSMWRLKISNLKEAALRAWD